MHTLKLFILKLLKMLQHVSTIRSSSGSCLFLAKSTLLKTFTAVNIFNNVILARNRQLTDDDRMVETCRSIFKSFNINNLSTLLKPFIAVNVFNNVILARNRQLPDDDQMVETCRSIFKSFNINNLSVCIGWCTDQMFRNVKHPGT